MLIPRTPTRKLRFTIRNMLTAKQQATHSPNDKLVLNKESSKSVVFSSSSEEELDEDVCVFLIASNFLIFGIRMLNLGEIRKYPGMKKDDVNNKILNIRIIRIIISIREYNMQLIHSINFWERI